MSGKENADEVDKKSKHLRGMSILVSFIYIAFGLLLVIFPTQMANLVCILLGVISLVFGIVRLTKYFTKSKEEAAMAYDLVVGILFIALGVVVLVFQKGVLSILPIVFGIFLLISALMKVQNSIDVKRMDGEHWWLIMIFAVVSAICGIILIIRPDFVINFAFIIYGIFLVVDGLEGLISNIMYATSYKNQKKGPKVVDAVSAEVVDDSTSSASSYETESADTFNTANTDNYASSTYSKDPVSPVGNESTSQGNNFDPDTGKPLK